MPIKRIEVSIAYSQLNLRKQKTKTSLCCADIRKDLKQRIGLSQAEKKSLTRSFQFILLAIVLDKTPLSFVLIYSDLPHPKKKVCFLFLVHHLIEFGSSIFYIYSLSFLNWRSSRFSACYGYGSSVSST